MSHKNENSGGSTYVATKRAERGEKDTMEAIIVRTKTPWLVGMDGKWAELHRRWRMGSKPQRRTLVVLQKSSATDGTSAGSK